MQTIGERLEEARKKKGISIREAAEATKIRGDYLTKFETNHFDIGLTEIYTRGFLRTYSNFLKLPADRILSDYAALGRGDVRPQKINRDVYGRIDISVASAGEASDRAAPPETTAAPEPSHANRGPARPRTGSSLPTGPDPATVFKYVKWGGIAVVGFLAILLIWSFFSGTKRPGSTANTTGTGGSVVPRGPVMKLNAFRTVQIRVVRALSDVDEGELIWAGTLAAGETKSVPWTSAVFIEGTPSDALELEVNGGRVKFHEVVSGSGGNKAKLPPPPAQ
ncbi:MAG: helix-turn-helix domain-containing protein [Verrucomicrobiota bacterium]